MSGINNQTLRLIQKNDPNRASLRIGLNEINDVVPETGLAIKNNVYIEDLLLHSFDEKKAAIGWYQPLFDGMAQSKSLTELTVGMGSMRKNSVKSLNLFLLHPDTTIDSLTISRGLMNTDMFLLEDGLERCKSLKTLSFRNVRCTHDGLCFLESVLPEMKLTGLSFYNSSINDHGARAIFRGIWLNNTIQYMNLVGLECSEEAMTMLIRGLFRPSSTVKTLNLYGNEGIFDADIHDMANLMSTNMNSLSALNLGRLRSVTAAGWIEFSRSLSTPQSGLEVLQIRQNAINDDVIVAFAAALRERNNSTMKKMDVSYGMHKITEVGWGAIKNLLCDASSINATRYSDHTLCYLGDFPYTDDDDNVVKMPSSIGSLLKMNENRDKSQVARKKVIETHFSDGKFDMEEHRALIGDENKHLPQTMHWFGRDALGHSVMYDLVRKNANLIRNPEPEKSSKRTFSMI